MLIFNRLLSSLAVILLVEIHFGSASSVFVDGSGDDVKEAYEDVRNDNSPNNW